MVYTVKQLSDLAGVSIRTLHYYDEIGLLKPASYGDNYNDEAAPQLQQILFFKELDFNLEEIRSILSRPDFDVLHTLKKASPPKFSDRYLVDLAK